MANYTAADIKALRERTGAGMMDVKKALDEADGDADKAVEILRVKGLKGVTKREGRSTAKASSPPRSHDGVGVLVEVNCETDFVAKADKFIAAGRQGRWPPPSPPAPPTLEALLATDVDGKPLAEVVDEAGAIARREGRASAASPASRAPTVDASTCTRPPRTSRRRSACSSRSTATASAAPRPTTSPMHIAAYGPDST